MKKSEGLDHWLAWIGLVKQWVAERPSGIAPFDYYDVNDVDYDDLAAIAAHFNIAHLPENSRHMQSVELELSEDFSITFYSPVRAFYYAPIG